MKKTIITFVFSFLIIGNTFSQIGISFRNFRFESIPQVTHTEDSLFQKEGIFCPIFRFAYQYTINNDQQIDLWQMEHRAFKLYDAKHVSEFKTIDFGDIDPSNIMTLQVRVIKNNEVVKTYYKKDAEIIKGDDEDYENSTMQIKISDLDIGSIVEFIIVKKREYIVDQESTILQHNYPIRNLDYTLVMPKHLKPYVELYNGLYPILDTIIEDVGTRYTTIHIDYLPALKKEVESFYEKYFCRIEFNIAYNYASSRLRMNTTKDFVNNFYERIQLTDKNQIKIIKNEIIKKIKFPKNATELDKIKTIEHFMKEQLGGIDLGAIYMTRFYAYVYDHFKIDYDIVITCNKTEKEFDKNFNGSNFFNNILYYFPTHNFYISLMDYSFRNGLIPMNYSGNTALFLQKVKIGNEEVFIHNFKKIPESPKDAGIDNLNLNLKIDPKSGAVVGTIEREMGSYRAHFIQANFKAFEVEDREQILELFLTLNSESTHISNEQFLNNDAKDIGLQPFIIKADITNTEWVKVLPSYLEISLGKMIGKQDRIDTVQRQLPLEKEYPQSYSRVITIEIPDGYSPGDLTKIEKAIYDTDDPNNANAGFISNYKMEGTKLIITVTEFYSRLYYPVSDFNLYKRVANSAADFNDLVIQLVKD